MNNNSLHSFEEYQRFNNKLFIYTVMAIEPLILAGAILGFQDNHVMRFGQGNQKNRNNVQ